MSIGFRFLIATLLMSSVAARRFEKEDKRVPARKVSRVYKKAPIKTGRILEQEMKGRITTLKIETTEGESYEVKLTPLLEFFVVGNGDAGFVRPGVFINARGTLTNDVVFLNKVTVLLLPKGSCPPIGKIQKAAAQQGESLQTYEVSGVITATAPAEDYPDHTALALKVSGRAPPVWLEPGFQVEVASKDPDHIAAGADVEMAMKVLRGGRLLPAALKVHREADFDSTEILGAPEAAE